MEAIRLHPSLNKSNPYSGVNPAPPAALVLDSGVPIPQSLKPGELLIKVEATTMVRDSLTWPEIYDEEYKVMGWDFAGTVVAASGGTSSDDEIPPAYKLGDEIYGMTSSARAGTWSQYAVVSAGESFLKPKSLTWEQAASVPMSALTAYQALFEKAGLAPPVVKDSPYETQASQYPDKPAVLVTGAAGSVGLYVVQLARLANLHVVAATRSNIRNKEFLKQIGADEVVEYSELVKHHNGRFQVIFDSVGGSVLEDCWSLVQEDGSIISIDSASYDFVQEHRKRLDSAQRKERLNALFFIVEPSRSQLEQLSTLLDAQLIKPFVACVAPLAETRSAYENTLDRPVNRGKIVLKPK